MSQLEQELKVLIIDTLELEDMTSEDIDSNEPLFADGLGLDSIDALEIGVAIQKKFQIKLDANSEDNKKHFQSISSIAKFIESNQ
ncbi:phosphopantetheine-binding protein [Pleionea sediminis]|uniref:phosphopantetheine-binding protein n=1 Tax=Pleionea sediminis TaxID=2569479 RepID=UPI0011847BF3|nr:phosphopantetheine-binding protein [Pleionea sediminis]